MPTLVHNERLKLTATYANGLAIAVFAVGGFAPIFGFLSAERSPNTAVIIFVAICFPMSVSLHLIARRALEGLRDDTA